MTDGQTDGQTDRRTDRRTGKNNMSPDPEGGDIIFRLGVARRCSEKWFG